MQRALMLLLMLVITSAAFGKAYFAPRDEMLAKADVIAVVDITRVKELEPGKQYGNQQASADVVTVLKGKPGKTISFFVPCFFPCALVKLKSGRYIVFLTKEKGKLQGNNWHLSYRPILKDKVEWYTDGSTLALTTQSVDRVLGNIRKVLATQQQKQQSNRNT
jgi:hypothetical protein